MFGFEVVDGTEVKRILDHSIEPVVALVRDAYLRHDAGATVNPDSYFLRFPDKPDARIIALPAFLDDGDRGITGIKWISSFPGNVAAGRPRASAVLVLNDYDTGYPIALLEAAGISAARTAASAAVAAHALRPYLPGAATVSVIGAGVIARTILRYLAATGYPMDNLLVYDVDSASATKLAEFARTTLEVPATVAGSIPEILTAQTVITATTAGVPYLESPLRPGQLALNISLRDFSPDVIVTAENYFDDVEHCLKAGTSAHLAESQTGGREFVTGTLADVLQKRVQPDGRRPVIFSPFGLGVLDLAVGHYVLTAARASGAALEIPNFFGETRRW